jgi:hypothetical protein
MRLSEGGAGAGIIANAGKGVNDAPRVARFAPGYDRAPTMNNPWLTIPLADYEGHMALPAVGQAQLLAELFAAALRRHVPRSAAVLGCAGGNGFERAPATVERLVGVDVNPDYVAAARERFGARPGLELHVADLAREPWPFAPVDLVFAALLFEYVEPAVVCSAARAKVSDGGILVAVVQLQSTLPDVTPTSFRSLAVLESAMRLVPPDALERSAAAAGFRCVDTAMATASGGKHFAALTLQR